MAAKSAVKRRTARTHSPAERCERWRILIFMATETESLVEPAKADLLELLGVECADDVRVFVHVHGFQIEPRQPLGSQCYEIKARRLHKCDHTAAREQANEEVTAAISFASAALRRFVRAHVQDLPSQADSTTNLVLVLWGHAQGVAEAMTGLPARSPFRAQPLTYAGASGVDIARVLRCALKTHGPVRALDLLVFDSCFMGALEVVAEFHDVARYVVASQATVELPALQLGALVEASMQTDDRAKLGHAIVAQASDSSTGTRSLTLFQPSKAEVPTGQEGAGGTARLTLAFLNLTAALHRGVRHPALAGRIFRAFHDAPFREVRQFLDLRKLSRLLARIQPHHDRDPQIAVAARSLHSALDPDPDGFVVEVCERDDRTRFGGVSIYCPWFRASHEQLRAGVADAVVDTTDYQRLALVAKSTCDHESEGSWGHLMLALAPAWELGRADGRVDGLAEATCPCCGRAGDTRPGGPDVRAGDPKEPKLGDDGVA